MKKFVLALILILLSLPVVVFAAPTLTLVYDPFEKLYTPGSTDPYPDGAPYDLVAHGDNEAWETLLLTLDDGEILKLIGIGKQNEVSGDDSIEGTLEDFTFQPSDLTGINTGSWKLNNVSKYQDAFKNGKRLYFSIKAGNYFPDKADNNKDNGFLLFAMNDDWYANMNQAVHWSTVDNYLRTLGSEDIGLGGKDISHIAFWTGPNTGLLASTSQTPEPATMLLLGFGLLGLAGISRKRQK